MKTGNNKWLIVLLAALLACCLVTGTLFACDKSDNDVPTPTEEGAEKGVYSLDEINLTLNGTGNFTLAMDGNLSSGTYKTENEVITLTFNKTEDGTATCALQGNILVLTIGAAEYRLYKQVKLTVTFNDGASTSAVEVTNGNLVTKPTDPVNAGYKFIAWYKAADFSGKPFDFQTEKITADVTLYAKWIEYVEGTTEYTVSFNLGYDTTEAIASQRTVSGKLVDGAPVPTREGYTFKGWWISAYNQADKLTCQYADGSSFTSDTTLFALWQADGTTLGTMDVTSTGVVWAGVSEAAKLTITKPDGTTVEQPFGATGASAYKYDLSAQVAGEYKFTLTYGSNTIERYYLNKALSRVSGFKVVGNSILLFDGVDNAEGYYITVKCGNAEHNHNNVYIGKSTSYNFVNCAMRNGGIEFTVKAVAANYLESVATFTFDRSLAAVTGISYDATTGLLTWTAVENAQHYIVTVGEAQYYLGTETKLDIKSLPAGEVDVTVKAVTEGFNSAAATAATINKTDAAAPSQLAVEQGLLKWNAVEGATSYRVQINDVVVDVTEAQLVLDAKYITIGNQYSIKIKAVFENTESLWSDAFVLSSAKAGSGLAGLTYANGKFGWTAMSDADIYEYKVNSGVTAETTSNHADVHLTKEGVNQLYVRYRTLTGDYSDWATFEVYAYSITFDSMGGAGVGKQYKAIDDTVEMPTSERVGYDFAGWYNVAGGSASNGTQFTAKTFDYPANIVLYANWLPRSYEITLDYNVHGEGTVEKVSVKYTGHYTLPVPDMLTDDESAQKGFVGWYATADGKGVQYTDELGNSLAPWNIAENTVVYAKYVNAFVFSPDGEGGYSVKAGKTLGYYTSTIRIPAKYNGLPVRSIAEYGFKDYPYLTSVTLPDTLESIPTTAFDGCKRIEAFHIAETDHSAGVFSEVDGSIVMKLYGQTTLHLIPAAFTGTFRVPAGVSTIGSRTFNNAKFDTVVIPASVTNIEADAFVNCANLKMVIFDETELKDESGNALPKQLLTIDNAAFNDTLYVEKFILPARLAEITNVQQFFSQFKLLSSIEFTGAFEKQVYSALTVNDGGKNIAGMLANANRDEIIYCPIGLSSATEFEVEIPSSIIRIAAHAFDSFEEAKNPALKKYNPVTKITFNGNLASIGDYAFNKSKNLTEVTFKAVKDPIGLTIGDYAFYRCNKLNVVIFEENGAWNGDDFTATESCGVASIGEYAFDSASITELKLPNSLTSLGAHAFEDSSVKTIDLSDVSAALEFGDYAFANCRALVTCELTKNVGTMNFNLVFYNCKKYKPQVSADNPNYQRDDNGVLYNKDMTMVLFFPDSFEGVYTIPDTVTTIAGAVFKGKSNMLAIVISSNVTVIGDSAFEDCSNLASVTFAKDGESGLTIGARAFLNCTSLTEIELPARTVSIGEQAFTYYGVGDGSRVLAKVTLNEGLQTIGEGAFQFTDALKGINIPSTVTSIGDNAFYGSGIETLMFATGGTEDLTLGTYVFYMCNNIVNVVLPERLVNIPDSTFKFDKALKSVTIPTTVANIDSNNRAIGRSAFEDCVSLSNVVFTSGGSEPLSFGAAAFKGCDALTVLSLPNRISAPNGNYDVFEFGGGYGSSGDYPLANQNAPAWQNSASIQDDFCFITDINVEEGGSEFSSYKGVLYNADKSVLVWCPYGKTGEVEVAKEATTFRVSSFYNCHNVTSVVFQKGGSEPFYMADVAKTGSWGDTVFFACYRLETIAFPARLSKIGNYALIHETSTGQGTPLTSVTFEQGCNLASIGEFAFQNQRFTDLVLPDGVETVGANVFNGAKIKSITLSKEIDAASVVNITASATYLTNMVVPEDSATISVETDATEAKNRVIYNKDKTELVYVDKNFTSALYTIPASVTKIGAGAFKDRKNVTGIAFATSADAQALTIGDNAFNGCGITSVELPARISSLGTYVFANCASLTTVTFAEGYKYAAIPDYMFQGCRKLTSIAIPGEVSSIGRGAFNNASVMATIEFALTADGQASKLQSIGADAFNNCTKLANIKYALKVDESGNVVYAAGNTLPYTVTALGASGSFLSGPFYKCTSLKSINLPDELTAITGNSSNKGMFEGCTSLTTVKLPSQLKEIKQSAFKDSGITTLDFSGYEDGSLTIYEGAFSGATKLTALDLTKVGKLYLYKTFDGCKALASLTISNNIQLLGKSDSGSTYYYAGFGKASVKEIFIDQDILPSMFKGNTNLTKVTLGEHVTKIADSAFEGCTKLATVDTTAVGTLEIGSSVFSGASMLANFDMSKVVSLGKKAFYNCKKLAEIGSFNDTITAIPESAFEGCAVLASFDLGNVTTLGMKAFKGTAVQSVTIPATITSISSSVFEGCTSLTSVTYNTAAKVSSSMFKGCTKLATVTLCDDVSEIGDTAFSGCTSLKEINLNKVATVGSKSFEKCSVLAKITIGNPDITFHVYGDSFTGVTGASFAVPENTVLKADGGILYSGTKLVLSIDSRADVVVLKGTTEIAPNAFRNNTSVETITLPESVEIINGYNTFNGCTNLRSINLENVTRFETNEIYDKESQDTFKGTAITELKLSYAAAKVFRSMTKLTKVTFVGEYAVVENEAFKGCTALTTIEGNVVEVYDSAFNGCTSLTSFDAFKNLTEARLSAFANTGFTELVLPDSLVTIGNQAFNGCKKLTSVTLSNSVVNYGSSVFGSCTALTQVTFGSNMASVPMQMFSGCTALESIVIPDGVTTICKEAFKGCTALTSVTIPDSVKTIEDGAFKGCIKLATINLPTTLTSLGEEVFSGCSVLNNVVIPTGITLINEKLFYSCKALTSVTLHGGITYVGYQAFYGCSALAELSGLNNVTEIDSSAFYNCSNLTTIGSIANVETIGNTVFYGCTKLNLTITGKTTSIGRNAFQKWTDQQTITFTDHTEASTRWDSKWNADCNATFVWATAEESSATTEE